ncbi:hypothetical protein HK097_010903 [Rhizophlyctis rosea]|uniref:Uncharacterized protein n=1 Tax=Rhizophlyctis rosea TaxID=64517 RepID=A0AAD5S8P3_9FUNG|nr:hypothetical protein HK097_010903 [Rhizophlyctis rosea]
MCESALEDKQLRWRSEARRISALLAQWDTPQIEGIVRRAAPHLFPTTPKPSAGNNVLTVRARCITLKCDTPNEDHLLEHGPAAKPPNGSSPWPLSNRKKSILHNLPVTGDKGLERFLKWVDLEEQTEMRKWVVGVRKGKDEAFCTILWKTEDAKARFTPLLHGRVWNEFELGVCEVEEFDFEMQRTHEDVAARTYQYRNWLLGTDLGSVNDLRAYRSHEKECALDLTAVRTQRITGYDMKMITSIDCSVALRWVLSLLMARHAQIPQKRFSEAAILEVIKKSNCNCRFDYDRDYEYLFRSQPGDIIWDTTAVVDLVEGLHRKGKNRDPLFDHFTPDGEEQFIAALLLLRGKRNKHGQIGVLPPGGSRLAVDSNGKAVAQDGSKETVQELEKTVEHSDLSEVEDGEIVGTGLGNGSGSTAEPALHTLPSGEHPTSVPTTSQQNPLASAEKPGLNIPALGGLGQLQLPNLNAANAQSAGVVGGAENDSSTVDGASTQLAGLPEVRPLSKKAKTFLKEKAMTRLGKLQSKPVNADSYCQDLHSTAEPESIMSAIDTVIRLISKDPSATDELHELLKNIYKSRVEVLSDEGKNGAPLDDKQKMELLEPPEFSFDADRKGKKRAYETDETHNEEEQEEERGKRRKIGLPVLERILQKYKTDSLTSAQVQILTDAHPVAANLVLDQLDAGVGFQDAIKVVHFNSTRRDSGCEVEGGEDLDAAAVSDADAWRLPMGRRWVREWDRWPVPESWRRTGGSRGGSACGTLVPGGALTWAFGETLIPVGGDPVPRLQPAYGTPLAGGATTVEGSSASFMFGQHAPPTITRPFLFGGTQQAPNKAPQFCRTIDVTEEGPGLLVKRSGLQEEDIGEVGHPEVTWSRS